MKTTKLKDGTEIKEVDKGTFSIVFPDKHYILITTWKGFTEISIPKYGIFELK